MHRLLSLPAFLFCVTLAHADDLTGKAIHVADGRFVRYADPATISRSGDMVKMWVLSDYNAAQVSDGSERSFSSKEQNEYDCRDERSRIIDLTLYSGKMGAGDVVYAYGGKPRDWKPIVPGTIDESLWKLACAN